MGTKSGVIVDADSEGVSRIAKVTVDVVDVGGGSVEDYAERTF